MSATDAAPPTRVAAEWLGHPRGLFLLFFVELWERFSYYGMRALLVFYLTKHFLLSDDRAFAIYGAYTSLVFITPVIGGLLADRILGARRAVLFGGILLTAGHALMVVEEVGGSAAGALPVFHLALGLIIVGVGFLKSNVSVLVGQLYPRDDMRRDPAFTIFYMGINIGAALGPIACGFLGETYGWRYGFGAAGLGMAVSLLIFVLNRRLLEGRGEPLETSRPGAAWLVYLVSIAGVAVSAWLVQRQEAVGQLLLVSAALTFGYILFHARRRLAPTDRRPIYLALMLIAIQPLFWGLYEQVGSSLSLFTDRHVDRTIFGVEVPAPLFVSLGAIYVVLLSPVFAWLWTALGRRGLEPSPPAKFGLALVQVGLGFLILVAGASTGTPTPVVFIFLLYLLHVTGELCLSPVGVSAMTRLSVPETAGLMMGAWFLATAAGNFMAGLIAQATSEGGVTTAESVISVYARMGWLAVGSGLAVCIAAPFAMKFARLEKRT